MSTSRPNAWATLLALMLGCGGSPSRVEPSACDSEFEYSWDEETAGQTAAVRVPNCPDVHVERTERGLAVIVHRRVSASLVAANAVAFRDPEGVGYVVARRDPQRYELHLPWRDPPVIAVGARPEGARASEILDVLAGPDGWWIWTWAGWRNGHGAQSRPPLTTLVHVSRDTFRVTEVRWPGFLDPAGLRITPTAGGLDVIAEDDPVLPLRFRIQRRSGCGLAVRSVVSVPPRCRSTLRVGECLGSDC